MSESAPAIDDATMKFGLLMESAQAHQKLAETHLEKLRAHTQDLDGVVREEIRRTLIEELQELTAESKRAAQALHGMKRAANLRGLLWSVGVAVLCTAIPSAIARWALPSAREIAALRLERDQLSASIARLVQQGGRVDWRHCGDAARLCVRVDRNAPTYGDKADYYIVKGH
ncbi:MAG: hypothetical protein ACLP2F_01930 [Steroidobacteraceae bacterium]